MAFSLLVVADDIVKGGALAASWRDSCARGGNGFDRADAARRYYVKVHDLGEPAAPDAAAGSMGGGRIKLEELLTPSLALNDTDIRDVGKRVTTAADCCDRMFRFELVARIADGSLPPWSRRCLVLTRIVAADAFDRFACAAEAERHFAQMESQLNFSLAESAEGEDKPAGAAPIRLIVGVTDCLPHARPDDQSVGVAMLLSEAADWTYAHGGGAPQPYGLGVALTGCERVIARIEFTEALRRFLKERYGTPDLRNAYDAAASPQLTRAWLSEILAQNRPDLADFLIDAKLRGGGAATVATPVYLCGFDLSTLALDYDFAADAPLRSVVERCADARFLPSLHSADPLVNLIVGAASPCQMTPPDYAPRAKSANERKSA